ncbi:proton-coupled zinc antiporter SLC30A9, mitochondrial [Hoplias malabaricus]|uniref:proton-coupled zinc antiporter SLC30A9, mitochondrial n=1 Tax=Hoplias malabaricus TaxID=27720 RepID=UPI0034617BAA
MSSELQQVIRYMMFLYRVCKCKRLKNGGGLLILLSYESNLQNNQQIFTVAAAGQWFDRVSRNGRMSEVIETLSSFISFCDCPYQEEALRFSENFGTLHFTCSFQVDQTSLDTEMHIVKFLQRLCLFNAQVEIIFKVKKRENTWQHIISFKSRHAQLVMDYYIADSTAIARSLFSLGSLPSCCRLHLVVGERFPILLPPEAVEAGLCGEVSVTSLAGLSPCMNQYPNWPARLSHIHMIAYSPSGIPIMQGKGQTQPSFLRSLTHSLLRGKLGLDGIHCSDTHTAQDPLFYEMEFSTNGKCILETEPACSQALTEVVKSDVNIVDQAITLFLLIQYRDPFNSQLFDIITNEEILERQLDRVLWHNVETVTSELQSTLENAMRRFLCRKKARETLQSAMSVIVSSVNGIVKSSSNAEFHSACLNSMKVKNTNDLSKSMHQTLQRVIGGRFISNRRCKNVEQNVSERFEHACEHQGPPGKRIHSETEECPVSVSKKQCARINVDGDPFENTWELLDSQASHMSSSQQSLRQLEVNVSKSSPATSCNIELTNKQIFSFKCLSLCLAIAGMFPSLGHRPWQVFCRVSMQQRAHLSQLRPRIIRPCYGWQSGGKVHSLWFSFPDYRGASLAWAQLQYYSTAGSSKDGPPQNPDGPKPTEKLSTCPPSTEVAADGDPSDPKDSKPQGLTKAENIQVKVRAVLKKREYGTKYTQNNFITAVRAMNEFCLKPSDLEQLRRIRRRSPHDDTEAFTVFLRSDVEAKALDVWGSMEALARERKLRKQVEREYQENIFRNQQLLKEYKDFWGNTKPRSGKRVTFLQGPGKVVMVAICINGLNFFFKLLAWVYTGSASMFSEAIHSLADTCNQALLALGISQSVRNPDAVHPYGFSNMRYIASLISGVGIFMMGAGLSWYHGIMGLLHPQPMESLLWAYCILAGSLVSEGATLLVAINEIRKSAHKEGVSFYEYVMQSRDPSTNVVLLEDAAAVLGVMLAAGCMGLTSLTGNPYYDSLGSLGVGTLLGTVSAFLIYTNTEALLGRSIQAEHVQKLTEFLESDPAVRAIHDVKATDMGLSTVRFKAEVDFDGRVVTRSYLEKQDIDQILSDIQQVKTPEELEAFMLKHGENIIDTLGAEVDRLEKELKQRNPEVRHVDLEIL